MAYTKHFPLFSGGGRHLYNALHCIFGRWILYTIQYCPVDRGTFWVNYSQCTVKTNITGGTFWTLALNPATTNNFVPWSERHLPDLRFLAKNHWTYPFLAIRIFLTFYWKGNDTLNWRTFPPCMYFSVSDMPSKREHDNVIYRAEDYARKKPRSHVAREWVGYVWGNSYSSGRVWRTGNISQR